MYEKREDLEDVACYESLPGVSKVFFFFLRSFLST